MLMMRNQITMLFWSTFLVTTITTSATPVTLNNVNCPTGTKLFILGSLGGPLLVYNRTQTSHLLIVNNVSYIIDAGGGSTNQLAKVPQPFDITSIRHIFLTHQHSDHIHEFGNMVETIYLTAGLRSLSASVTVHGPPPIRKMVRDYKVLYAKEISIREKDNNLPPFDPLMIAHQLPCCKNRSRCDRPFLVMKDENVRVSTILVDHPNVYPSFGFRFDLVGSNGTCSIVFSGDTIFTPNMITLANGADVLIHETLHNQTIYQVYPPALAQHLLKIHTTCEEVGQVATQARVKNLVLGHLVPGGPPYLSDEVWINTTKPYYSGNIIVARDMLQII